VPSAATIVKSVRLNIVSPLSRRRPRAEGEPQSAVLVVARVWRALPKKTRPSVRRHRDFLSVRKLHSFTIADGSQEGVGRRTRKAGRARITWEEPALSLIPGELGL
jgi:hypothetical protein